MKRGSMMTDIVYRRRRPIPGTAVHGSLEPERHAVLGGDLELDGLQAGPSLTCPDLHNKYFIITAENWMKDNIRNF